MEGKSTLTRIAERAGVSIATVSRIINDTGRVAPATRQKVLRVSGGLPMLLCQHRRHPGLHTVITEAILLPGGRGKRGLPEHPLPQDPRPHSFVYLLNIP